MRKLERMSQRLALTLQAASNILLIAIVVLIFVEVVSRYIFGESRAFMEEFSKWWQVWLTYLMLGVITKGRRHISIDILPRRLPERYKPTLFLVYDIAILGFAIVLSWSGIQSVTQLKELEMVSATEIEIPMWIVHLCIALGGMFLAFFSIERLAIDIVSLGKHPGEKE
mgnify:CR=1 FL=1